jgi:hypothetical protein
MGPRSLPLWLGDDDLALVTSSDKAVTAGLRRRPLRFTLADAPTYEQTASGRLPPHGAGLTDLDEAHLIDELRGTRNDA